MIRPATIDDVPAILGLIRELAEYEKLSHACVATEESLRRHLFGERPAAEALVKELVVQGQPRVVGYALFFQSFSTFRALPGLFLEDLYVQPTFRRQGIGKALLKETAAIACQRGYGRMEWSVLDWNSPSIEFYKSLGAVPLDDWTMFRLAGPALQAVGSSPKSS